MGTARHGLAIDRACPYLRKTWKSSLCTSCRPVPPAWLQHRRVGVPHSTPTVMIEPVLAAGTITARESDHRCHGTRDRSMRNNACAFLKARPFGSNDARVLTSSDISPKEYESVDKCEPGLDPNNMDNQFDRSERSPNLIQYFFVFFFRVSGFVSRFRQQSPIFRHVRPRAGGKIDEF